jgi:hypothetical protein
VSLRLLLLLLLPPLLRSSPASSARTRSHESRPLTPPREHPAEEVFVTGTFDNWTKSVRLEKVGDVFQKEVELEPQTDKIYYKVGAIFVAVVVFVVVVFLLLFLPPVFVVVVATVGQVDNGGGGGGSRPLSSHLGRLAPLTLAAHRAALPPSRVVSG